MTRGDNPENTIPASPLMSHAADHASPNKSWHSLTHRHHRKCDRAVGETDPSAPLESPASKQEPPDKTGARCRYKAARGQIASG